MQAKSAMGLVVCLVASAAVLSPAAALTEKECSTKYQAAKSAGTLAGKTWNDFRKSECGADSAAATTEPATKPAATAETAKTSPPAKTTAATSSSAVFPSVVSSKYSSETPGKARRHTCLDQYKANKASNANGGLKWIVKGGGYYSECNKRLKG